MVDALNARFREGAHDPTNAGLEKAGVLIHHFDSQGNAEKPWLPCPEMCYGQPCWCSNIRDRLSATILNARLPKAVSGKIPNYSDVNVNAAAGFILNPSFTTLLCAFPHDGGTAMRTCDPPGVSADCLPGCFGFDREGGGRAWCDEGGGLSCAFKAKDVLAMLDSQRAVTLSGGVPVYNEVVIDMAEVQRWLPRSIEAVWFMKNWNCYEGGSMLCEGFAKRTQAQLLLQYGLTAEQVPLITFDSYNWQAPFAKAW